MENCHFDIFADYFQFYIADDGYDELPRVKWSVQCIKDKMEMVPGLINIGTARNMTVPVEVEVRECEPREDFDKWDHIAEAGIDIRSRVLIIAGYMDPQDEAPRIQLKTGSYKVWVYYGGLDTLSPDGLEGEDRYKIVLWPGIGSTVKVIKRHQGV